MDGIDRWKLNGWTSLRIHYLADPNKRGLWATRAREGYSSQAWAQEQDIDFSVQPGEPIFCDTERISVGQYGYAPWLPLVSGLDYSFLANVCLTGQVRKREDGRYGLRILTETVETECFIKPFRDRILTDRARLYANHAAGWTDFGDYSANTRTATGVLIEEIRPITLITVPTGPGGVRKGIEVIQYLISAGLLEIDVSCAQLLRTLRTGYVWDEKKRDSTNAPVPAEEHPFEDLADALRYLVVNLFEVQDLPTGGHQAVLKPSYRGTSWATENPPTGAVQVEADQRDAYGRVEHVRQVGYRGDHLGGGVRR
jgi:hypothetical protein